MFAPHRFTILGYAHHCLAVLGMLALAVGCREPNQYQEPPPPPVTVSQPELRTVVDTLEFTGTTVAVELVDIRARVEGFLTSIKFREGMAVKRGDTLFTIDARPFRATLAQAKASKQLAAAQRNSALAEQKRAEAEVINAKSQLERVEQAVKVSPGAVTEEEVETRRTAVLTAQASLEAAKAAITSAEAEIAATEALITQAELELNYCDVRSPINGRAGKRMVDVGNLVGSGESTILTSVVSYDPIHVFFNVNENDLLGFIREQVDKKGKIDEEEVELDQLIRIGLSDEEGFPHEGKADYSDLAVDQSTGTYEIRGVIPNSKRIIPPGAFVRVSVPRGEVEALLVDPRAVGRDQSGAYLLSVNASNVVERHDVQLGPKYDGLQAIRGEVSTNDWIIVNGLQRARVGATVAPRKLAADSQQAAEPPPSAPAQPAEE